MRKLDSCDFCGDAPSGVYEVVPEDVPADTHRLVLCADCRETLATVISPLLAALDGGATAETEAPETPADARSSGPQVDDARERTATDAEPTDEDRETGETEPEPTLSVEMPGSSADADDGSNSDGDGAAAESESAPEAEDARPERPDGYAKVVRLLRNRPAAMPREDLVDLASNAYDLDEATVDEAIDAAVENGHVVETPDGLQT